MNDRLAGLICGAATIVWVLSMALDTIPSLEYQPPASVHGVMVVVATAAAAYIFRKGSKE